ncbi:MAG: ABC transporter permease subunit [Halobacteriales archaeon]|nr:ABC transporter permease subunit [Halobacteriales archaeon]
MTETETETRTRNVTKTHVCRTVFEREIRTVLRTRAYIALGLVYAVVVVAVAWFSGGVESGYLPTAVSLSTPSELLVPVVSFALGYRVVLNDRATGELEVLKTYGIGRAEYVVGVYAGRLLALVVVLTVPLFVVGALSWYYAGPHTTVLAWHGGADNEILLVRFAFLTVLFGASVLSLSVAVSAVSDSVRSALALVVVVWLAIAVGADVGIMSAVLTERLGDTGVVWLTSLSPNTAYRGLVMETVVGVAVGDVRATSVAASTLSLLSWTVVPLAVAVFGVWRD